MWNKTPKKRKKFVVTSAKEERMEHIRITCAHSCFVPGERTKERKKERKKETNKQKKEGTKERRKDRKIERNKDRKKERKKVAD